VQFEGLRRENDRNGISRGSNSAATCLNLENRYSVETLYPGLNLRPTPLMWLVSEADPPGGGNMQLKEEVVVDETVLGEEEV